MTRGGLPHSDIPGSKLVCSSPGLFAACHVLHRLLAPRHSPYTLSSLTIRNSRTDAHQSFACQLVCDSSFRNTACVCGRKKLPFAEYSVVKDQACRTLPAICLRRAPVGSAAYAALQRSVPTSVQERLDKPRHSPKLFKERRLRRVRLCDPRVDATRELSEPRSARTTFRAGLPTVAVVQRAKVGGEYRSRTGDLLVANQALSQLS